jgi:hypothetical protein
MVDDLRSFLVAWQPGDVREVRIPKYDGRNTASGYFDNPDWSPSASGSGTAAPIFTSP